MQRNQLFELLRLLDPLVAKTLHDVWILTPFSWRQEFPPTRGRSEKISKTLYHPGKNDYRCKCKLIQKQFRKFKKLRKKLSAVRNSKNLMSAEKYDNYRFFFSISLSLSLALSPLSLLFSLLIWNDTYKIMVGCRSCTYPSIRTITCTRVGLLGLHCKKTQRRDCLYFSPS